MSLVLGNLNFDMYCPIVLKVGFAFEEHAIKLPVNVWLHQNTCNFTATKFNCFTAFFYLQRGQVQFVQLGQVQFEQQFPLEFPFPTFRSISTIVSNCLHGEIIKLIDNARVNFFWHYPCCVMDKHFCSIKEDNHWFSVPLKSKRLVIIKYWYLLCLTSNACAQSLLALCLIIILMLLQICRILCVIFVHSDVFRPCYSVEEGGGKILSLVLFVCLSVYQYHNGNMPKLFSSLSQLLDFLVIYSVSVLVLNGDCFIAQLWT